jgi:uncharacterized protein
MGDHMTEIEQSNLNINRSLATALTPTHLELIILPTEECNLRCTYCYEDFQVGRMADNIVLAIKRLISERTTDLRSFHLSWFGGEPLLAKDIIFDISEHAKAECAKHDVAFLQGEVTTNGYALGLPMLQALVELNQSSFQISLDGYREVHDTTRKMISGRGTFEKIWNNLLAMHHSDLDFFATLRLHLTPLNLESIEALIEQIKMSLLPDERFSVVFKAVGNWGGPNKGNFRILDKNNVDDIIAKFKTQLYGNALSTVNSPDVEPHVICYAAKPNSLLIRANGRIGKCTVALTDPRNSIGHINDDGTLTLDNDILKPWFRGYKDRNFDTLECPLREMPKQPQKEAIITFTRPPQKTPDTVSLVNRA